MRAKLADRLRIFSTLIGLVVGLVLSGCSEFRAASPDSLASLSQADLSIQSGGASAPMNQASQFKAFGRVFSGHEVYSWTHTLNDPMTNARLGACTELNGHSSSSYSVSCTTAGTLTVQLTIVDEGVTYGPVYSLQSIQASATVTPTPTPVPGGPNAAGSQLYSAKCIACHGSLSSNDIRSRTVSGVTSALSSVGQMRNISLTSTEIQEIVNALNGK